MFIETTAKKKVFELSKRIRFVNGGTSSSKTISILMWLIDYAQSHEGELLSVVSESLPHLKKGALRDFETIMKVHHYWNDELFNKTDFIYTFETGTRIEFFSADQPGKVHGPRRDVLYLNEANNVSYEIFTQLEIRTRKIIWVDSNPTHEYWMYTEVMPNRDVDFITVTYLDNEALEASIVEAIESRKNNANFWKVYGLGQLGDAEDRIYKDWQIIDDIPHEARLFRRGVDFGYTNDPTAIVDVYEYNGGLIVDEQCYQTGMLNRQIAETLKALPQVLTIADSSEPKSIDEIKGYGVQIIGAEKGQGSVRQGINYLQGQKVSITKRSLNLIREYRNYFWMKDRDGKLLNEPDGGDDHALDAVRYALSGNALHKKTTTIHQYIPSYR
jgi:phage terminase large subunit